MQEAREQEAREREKQEREKSKRERKARERSKRAKQEREKNENPVPLKEHSPSPRTCHSLIGCSPSAELTSRGRQSTWSGEPPSAYAQIICLPLRTQLSAPSCNGECGRGSQQCSTVITQWSIERPEWSKVKSQGCTVTQSGACCHYSGAFDTSE